MLREARVDRGDRRFESHTILSCVFGDKRRVWVIVGCGVFATAALGTGCGSNEHEAAQPRASVALHAGAKVPTVAKASPSSVPVRTFGQQRFGPRPPAHPSRLRQSHKALGEPVSPERRQSRSYGRSKAARAIVNAESTPGPFAARTHHASGTGNFLLGTVVVSRAEVFTWSSFYPLTLTYGSQPPLTIRLGNHGALPLAPGIYRQVRLLSAGHWTWIISPAAQSPTTKSAREAHFSPRCRPIGQEAGRTWVKCSA